MNYKFQGTLYRNRFDLANSIAYEWMTAGGANDSKEIDRFLPTISIEDEAYECRAGWGLSDEWMADRGLSDEDLVHAFRAFAEERPDRKDQE